MNLFVLHRLRCDFTDAMKELLPNRYYLSMSSIKRLDNGRKGRLHITTFVYGSYYVN